MTISSSLNASVAGLASNASRLATISDNISNSSTYGYKRAETDFHSMVIAGSRMSMGSNQGSYSAGGVRVTSQRLIDERGSLVSTSNPTDLAVRGRGMLPVTTETSVNVGNGDNPLLLATTGSFRPDSEGFLRSEAGLVLMGWPALPDGSVPSFPRDSPDGLQPIQINNNQFAGEATTRMALSVNLPATETEDSSAGETETLSVEYFDNLSKSATLRFEFEPIVPALGDPPTNDWNMYVFDSATGPAAIGQYTLEFSSSATSGGTLEDVTPVIGGAYSDTLGTLTVTTASGDLEVDIGALGDSNGLTQLSNAFAPVAISKNGSPVGGFTSVEIDANGFLRASFDSGVNRVLYQIPLIDVPNVNGLETLDSQVYRVSPDSGTFFMWDAGDGPTGDIISFAREESTTDVAGELTDLIQTQRAYSSNAKVIQTVDEMLQETTNIKR